MVDKMQKVMHEFKHKQLHSGSSTGPKVTNRKQAVAIAMSEARKAGQDVGPSPTHMDKTKHSNPRMQKPPMEPMKARSPGAVLRGALPPRHPGKLKSDPFA